MVPLAPLFMTTLTDSMRFFNIIKYSHNPRDMLAKRLPTTYKEHGFCDNWPQHENDNYYVRIRERWSLCGISSIHLCTLVGSASSNRKSSKNSPPLRPAYTLDDMHKWLSRHPHHRSYQTGTRGQAQQGLDTLCLKEIEMNLFRPRFCIIRLYWTGNTWLMRWICYKSCSCCRSVSSTCWPAVQRATTLLRKPHGPNRSNTLYHNNRYENIYTHISSHTKANRLLLSIVDTYAKSIDSILQYFFFCITTVSFPPLPSSSHDSFVFSRCYFHTLIDNVTYRYIDSRCKFIFIFNT